MIKRLAIVLGLVGLLYYFKDQFIVAWVNGRPVSRSAYVAELQRLAGNQALDSLLVKQLISAEAAKQKISVSREEVDGAVTTIEERAKEQGTSLDELLQAQNISLAAVREEVRLQKLLEKMVGPVAVGEEEVKNYFEENRKALYPDKTIDEVKEEISTQLQQEGLINKIQALISRLQAEAKVVKWLK